MSHPAWLIAHAQNLETDPIHRGKWIREKLLAGTIPDVPITVDAVIPPDPKRHYAKGWIPDRRQLLLAMPPKDGSAGLSV